MTLRYSGHPVPEKSGAPSLRRPITVNLTLAGAIGIGMVGLIALSWAFAFGVIIGRGLEPEETVPMLGRLAPQQTAPVEEQTVIKPEELTFLTDLKSQPALSTENPPAPQRTAPVPPQSAEDNSQGAQTPPARDTRTESVPPPDDNKMYNFVFQVIAYKRAEQADNFREKLEESGLRTRLKIERTRQGTPRIYQVQVLFKGTEEGARQVKDILETHGVKQPVISRTPA
jgi:cell division protein FtsN